MSDSKKELELLQRQNEELRLALDRATQKRADRESEFFKKSDDSVYLIKNLNATIAYLELHERDFVTSLVGDKKVTLSEFHKLLSAFIKK